MEGTEIAEIYDGIRGLFVAKCVLLICKKLIANLKNNNFIMHNS